jgi:hypothetical protein
LTTLSHAIETFLRGDCRLNRVRLTLVALGLSLIVSAAVLTTPSLASARLSPSKPSAEAALPALQPRAYLPISFKNYIGQIAPSCRYGATALSKLQVDWLPALGTGWYLNFWPDGYSGPSTARFVPVIKVHQDKNACQYLSTYSIYPALADNQLGSLIAAHPSALWLVGNEPDRGPNPENCLGKAQDDTYPEVYARAYHDTYTFIKAKDPTAQVAIAGLVEVTPGRLQYLDKVWQSYSETYGGNMPVDVWNMHLYILPEARPDGQPNGIANVALGTDPALAIRESGGNPANCSNSNVYCWANHDDLNLFANQVVAMRTWMKAHGQQNKPLILSEFSLLYPFLDYDDPINPTRCYLQDEYGKCFTQQRVTDFLKKSFNYLETAADPNLGFALDHNRLVQQWMWYSMNLPGGGAGDVSNLLTNDLSVLTQPGQAYRGIVAAQALSANLFLDPLPVTVAGTISPGTSTGLARLAVTLRNNGNAATGAPITVTFYANAGLSQVIGSVPIPAGLDGCATSRATVSVDWSGLALGRHPYWIQVKSNVGDYVVNGIAEIFAYRTMLPVLRR